MDRLFKKQWQVISLFILLSIISFIPMMKFKLILGSGDLLFHLNRMLGIAEGFDNGTLTYRSFNVLSSIGSSVNYFYPFVAALPFILLFVLLPNHLVLAFYIGQILLLFVTFMIAYESMLSYAKNKLRSILFAVLWGFSCYRTFLVADQYVLGEALAFTFLPLVFLGFYHVFFGDTRRWYLLAIGMTLILYSHMLSVLLTLGVFFLWLIIGIFLKQPIMNRKRITACFKSVGLFFILSAIVWAPFIYALRLTNMQTTTKLYATFMSGLGEAIVNSANNMGASIGLLPLLAVISVIIQLFRKNFTVNVLIGVVGVFLFVLGTNTFPWYVVPFKIQSLIQFPYRLFSYATLFLLIYFSKYLMDVFSDKKSANIMTVIMLALSIMMFIGRTSIIAHDRIHNSPLSMEKNMNSNNGKFEIDFLADNDQIKNIKAQRHDYIGMTDYAPVSSWLPENQDSILNHRTLVNGNYIIPKANYYYDRITYRLDLKTNSLVNIPVLCYGNEKVTVDNKMVNYKQSTRGTIELHITRGKHKVMVSSPTPKWINALWIITIIEWCMILIIILYGKSKSVHDRS